MRSKLYAMFAAVILCLWIAPVVGASATCASAPSSGGDWPVFQHDVTATGNQPAETSINVSNVGSLTSAWVVPLSGTVESEAVEDAGCVFIATSSAIYAFDVQTGQFAWRQDLPTGTTLSIANGRVFAQRGSFVDAFDEQTGALLWEHDMAPYSSIGSPLAFAGYVIAGAQGCSDFGSLPTPCRGYYVILDQATGAIVVDGFDVTPEQEQKGMEGAGFWSHPSYDPEDKYIYFGAANIRNIDPENQLSDALLKIDADPSRASFGRIVGYFRDGLVHSAAPQVCGDYSLPTFLAQNATCIDDNDWPSNAVIFRDDFGRKLIASTHSNGCDSTLGDAAGVDDTYASFAAPCGNFYGIDPTTTPTTEFGGTPMHAVWSASTSGARSAAQAYDGSKIYYSSGYDGTLIAVSKDNGQVAWRATTFGMNNFMHVTTANGVVYTPSSGSGTVGTNSDTQSEMLLAFNALNGTPLLERPLMLDVGAPVTGTTAGGVTIARNTLFVPTNGPQGSYLVAYRLP